ncbi:ERBB receptor feedback inhibitor 1-like isoform X1 [Gouania willdenowi]|uniref:ERBB receptor feedback inhibitor 1-like n=1 Tax=Gouania willdenowi TaxID=441366 RepID=A0A8C5ES14_GOUWI|nr:ERBB receptor feedback inhibitor 1-like isoform X1 [Gouania willdenowi]XP_028308949.1 ERBB receptor feedback inhibitor 1-like isoform X1 [Gouania willdenowi]
MQGFFYNMAASQNNHWEDDDLNRVCFGLSVDMEQNMKELQKDSNSNISLAHPSFNTDTYHLLSDNTATSEGDQVVPSSHKCKFFGSHQKLLRQLQPLPLSDFKDLLSDEAADCEVEFFTSDRQHLLPKNCPKAICMSSKQENGQVNYAFQERSMKTRMGLIASSWPSTDDKIVGRESHFGANIWTLSYHSKSCPSPASPPHSRGLDCNTDKPQVPPRIPISPKPSSLLNTSSTSIENRPPKIPPRVPLVPPCPSRTPSPKSLPIYINGVMPATQSFAANPKYVSKALQRQQNERLVLQTQPTPCILPILKDGRQASATHYILLPPERTQHSDRKEKLLSDPIINENISTEQRRL